MIGAALLYMVIRKKAAEILPDVEQRAKERARKNFLEINPINLGFSVQTKVWN